MATIQSELFLLDGNSFYTETEGETATVVRSSVGSKITQTEKDVAGGFYNSSKDEIQSAQIYNLNFGANYINQLGASDAWMSKALSDPTYKKVFKKATGKSGANINKEADKEDSKNWELSQNNTDANGRSTTSNLGIVLRYPLSESRQVRYDYLQVAAYEHKPNKFSDAGAGFRDADERIGGTSKGRVFLPMQPGISEGNNVGWGDGTANPFEAAAFGVAQKGITGLGQAKDVKGGIDAAKAMMAGGLEEVKNLGSGIDTNDIASYFAGQAIGNQGLFTRGTGKVLNPNLELLFTGPNLRTFNYRFQFTPREEREALEIKRIIKFFKINMAVKREESNLFLKTPNVFKLKYIFKNGDQHPFLNKIKMCALKDFTIDYTPDGSYMTYDDGSMTSYNVGLTFGELNPIYDTDFEKDNDTNDMGF